MEPKGKPSEPEAKPSEGHGSEEWLRKPQWVSDLVDKIGATETLSPALLKDLQRVMTELEHSNGVIRRDCANLLGCGTFRGGCPALATCNDYR
jgi:hypothetical protein